jgi:hypothetical protein
MDINEKRDPYRNPHPKFFKVGLIVSPRYIKKKSTVRQAPIIAAIKYKLSSNLREATRIN